jgi:hypothetical protein
MWFFNNLKPIKAKKRNEIFLKTKQNETKNKSRAKKRKKTKQNETKRNETKRNETKRNETKRNETKRNETNVTIFKPWYKVLIISITYKANEVLG